MVVASAALLAVLQWPAGDGGRARAADGDTPDLPQVRRIQIPPERLAAELERVKQGVLVQMPRSDFEAKWDRAVKATTALQHPPRLIEARYSAVLSDVALVRGTGQWRILNPAGGQGILAVQPLNLALQNARLQQPGDAILGDLDGKSLGLLVDSGEQTAFFDWSLRGIPSPDGIRFDVRVPACAVSSLELRLPADRAIAARDSFLLSGPHPAETPDLRLWRLDFAGQSQIDLMIRRTTRPDPTAPLVLAQVLARQEIEPDVVRADYEFDLESPHHGVQEFLFECDRGLHPYEVSVRNAAGALESWGVRAESPGKPTVFAVRLREPFQDATLPLKLQVRCWAPLQDRTWNCPEVRPVGGLLRGEKLLLRVHPDVRLEDWHSGTFAFTSESEIAPAPGGTKPRPPDVWQTYALVNQGSMPGGAKGRPRARVALPPADYRARQIAWWQIGTRTSSLTCWITYEVEHGSLHRLPLTVPVGWSVSRVDTDPTDLLRSWTVFAEEGRPTLHVDLLRPLTATGGKSSTPLRLRVELTPQTPWVIPNNGATVAVPDLAPRGAATREGALAISFLSLLEGKINVSAPASPPQEKGPWGRQMPDSYHAYRGMPVVGSVLVRPHRTQFRARAATDIALTAEGASVDTRLFLQPGVGSPSTIDVYIADGRADHWEWRIARGGNALKSVVRQPAVDGAAYWRTLGVTNPLSAAVRATAPVPQPQIWRLTFAQPLREPVRLSARGRLPVASELNSSKLGWFLAFPVVLGADVMEGEVTVQARDVVIATAEPSAALKEEERGDAGPRSPATWRAYRYQALPASLRISGQRRISEREAGVIHPAIPRASLIATVNPAGKLRLNYGFLIQNWAQRLLPLQMPADAQVLGVRVGGRWIGDLDTSASDSGAIVHVPVPAGPGPHALELVYELPSLDWKVWATVEATAPRPPVEPLAMRRIWRLPSGTVPVAADRFSRLPGSGPEMAPLPGIGGRIPASLSHEVAELAPPLAPFMPLASTEWREQQRDVMEQVAFALGAEARRRQHWTLGESVDYALTHAQAEPTTIVIDSAALRAEGLVPETRLALAKGARPLAGPRLFPPWEHLGLVYVPAEPAPLLSTARQVQAWESAAAGGRMLPSDVEHAVREASEHGHDRSGRFRSAVEWTASPAGPSAGAFLAVAGLGGEGDGFTDWEPLAGNGTPERITMVRQNVLSGAGWTLTAVLLVLAWKGQRWPRRIRLILLFAWLLFAGIALWRLPGGLRPIAWYPAAAAAVVALAAYLRSVSRHLRPPRVAVAGSIAILLAAALGISGQAPPPASFTVFIVPGDGDAADTVLVPPALTTILDTAGERGVTGLRTPVLLGAQYDGTAQASGTAEFRAEYKVFCFTDDPAPLVLPLANLGSNDPLQLKEAVVDGAPAFPEAARPPREGYVVKVKGKGTHVAVLRFSVATGSGEERGIHLALPEIVQSRLTFEAPAGSRHLYAGTGRGKQAVSPEIAPSAPADKPLKLEVDLGRSAVLHVRWREEGREPRPPRLHVREAYLWKLHPTASSLFAVYQFTVRQGTATALDLDVPESLEIRSVAAGRLPDLGPGEPLPRLRDWQLVKGHPGKLHLHFFRPLTRGAQVVLEFVPRHLPSPNAPLPLPAPRDIRNAEGYLAFQTDGLAAQVTEHLSVIGLEPKTFSQEWDRAGMPDPGSSVHAYSFQRSGGPPVLRLHLAPAATAIDARQRIAWRLVHARQADVTAVAHLRAITRPLSFIEWDVPEGIKDLEVSGADVRAWSRVGARVQVWLARPANQVDLRLSGWQALEPSKRGNAVASRLRLGAFHLPGAATTTYVYCHTNDGLALHAENLHHLALLPTLRRSERDLGFVAMQPDFAGDIVALDRPAEAEAHVLSFGELQDRDFNFSATLDIEPATEARTVTVRVLNADDAGLKLEAPGGIARHALPKAKGRQGWTLNLPPTTAMQRIRITGSLPLKPAPGFVMPDVRVDGLARVERNVAFAGRELRADEVVGLTPLSDLAERLRRWPAELDRIRRTGSAWQVRGDDWRLRLAPRAAMPALTASQLLLADYSAAVVDGERWLHRATFWIYHESDGDLSIELPAGARFKSLSIDDVEIMVPSSATNVVWVPRSRLSGARALRLAWVYDAETLDHPNLSRPRVAGLDEEHAQWTVHVPAGFELLRSRSTAPSGVAGDLDLERARALMRMSERIADHERNNPLASASLAAVQELFYRTCRHAVLADAANDAVTQLRQQNQRLADSHGFDVLRRQAEREAANGGSLAAPDLPRSETVSAPDAFSPAERGTPRYWSASSTREPPQVVLARSAERSGQSENRVFAAFLTILIGAVLVGVSPRLSAAARAFWPEQMLLLGIAGWGLLGPGWLATFLILLGISGRLAVSAGWLRSLRLRKRSAPPQSTVVRPPPRLSDLPGLQ